MEKHMEILSNPQQSGHEHDMTLREISQYCRSITCELCSERITGGGAFCCLDCSYFIHKECGELPAPFRHPIHPEHALTLVRSEWRTLVCKLCGGICDACYRCEQCNFSLDLVCAIWTLHQEEEVVVPHEILHFLHEHNLKCYRVTGENNRIECSMCKNKMSGPDDNYIYACPECRFVLDETCSKISQEVILPPFHEHALTYSSNARSVPCAICGYPWLFNGFYICDICDFGLDVGCAVSTVPPKEDCENSTEDIIHSYHDHRLSYFYTKSESRIPCKMCTRKIKGAFYGCLGCSYFTHKYCANLPQLIHHPLYPQHSLNLTNPIEPASGNRCDICGLGINPLGYRYDYTNYQVHIGCADGIKILASNEDGQSLENQYPGHEHPLILIDRRRDGLAIDCPSKCSRCQTDIEDGPAYYCPSKCRRWLHKECGEMPRVIEKHPLHPDHSLSVVSGTFHGSILCNVCCRQIGKLTMSCEECDFKLHYYCGSRRPTLKHHRHEHLLAYLETSYSEGTNKCGVCGKRCEFDLYHCATCKFDMHYFCAPLPPAKKSHRHVHEFSLLDSYLEDDSGKYYCWECAGTRHPQHGVYYCQECDIACHIECIIPSEIEDKAIYDLKEEITIREKKIDTEKENLEAAKTTFEAAKKNLEEAEKMMKELETQQTTSTQRLSQWTRKA